MKKEDKSFREAFGEDDKSLALFLRNMAKFNDYFCEFMVGGKEFTLRLEVRGERGIMKHCRVNTESLERTQEEGRKVKQKGWKKTSGIPKFPLDPK